MNGTELGIIRSALQSMELGQVDRAQSLLNSTPSTLELAPLRQLVSHYTNRSSPPPPNTPPKKDQDKELVLCIAGWSHYYHGEYESATHTFEQAWKAKHTWSSWTALGLGKVASDLTWWSHARRWLLESMKIAREESDLFRMAEAAGALGEVLLRSAHPKPAWELFTLDQALLPPGSEYKSRLENYRAICLSKSGFQELAEPILWAAFYAEISISPTSASYSCASLAALSFRHNDFALFKRLAHIIATHDLPLTGMPAGIFQTVQAYWLWNTDLSEHLSSGTIANASYHLKQATQHFGSTYPVESLWTRIILSFINNSTLPQSIEVDQLISRNYPKTTELEQASLPSFESSWLNSPTLPLDCGLSHFKPYLTSPNKAHQPPWHLLDTFFV